MNAIAQPTGGTPAIRPFRVNVPEAQLEELRRRIKATVWPGWETVPDAAQGVQLATLQVLARYWATEYDWRGHFAAWEQPKLFTDEVRAGFRALRA